MFLYWQSQQLSVPGGYHYGFFTITAAPDTQILSVGFQNDGNAVSLWASQMFIYNNGGNAYIQIVNSSATTTYFYVSIVSASTNGTAAVGTPTIAVTSA